MNLKIGDECVVLVDGKFYKGTIEESGNKEFPYKIPVAANLDGVVSFDFKSLDSDMLRPLTKLERAL